MRSSLPYDAVRQFPTGRDLSAPRDQPAPQVHYPARPFMISHYTQPAPIQVEIVASLCEVAPDVAEALETGCGAYLCTSRLVQLERDGRWRHGYVVAICAGAIVSVLPYYLPRHERWFDAAYNIPAITHTPCPTAADGYLLVGGRTDFASGLLRDPGKDPALIRRAALASARLLTELAREQRRTIAAVYVSDLEAPLFRQLLPAAIETRLGVEARLRVPAGGSDEYLRSLSSRRRSIVRRDWRDLRRFEIASSVMAWDEAIDFAPEMIASVDDVHGTIDHPKLIRMRLENWGALPEIDPVAFVAKRRDEVMAVALGWRWRSILQLYEVGLAPRGAPERHLAYVEALIYAPMRYAQSESLKWIHLGLDSLTPKRLRGASLHDVSAFVL